MWDNNGARLCYTDALHNHPGPSVHERSEGSRKNGKGGKRNQFSLAHTHTHTRNQNKLKSSDTKTIWHRYVTKLHDTLVPMTSSYNEIMNILRD